MISPGDVVTVDFRGAKGMKRRPAVVVSSDEYHKQRPDVVLGVLTTNMPDAHTVFDHMLLDWAQAGLHAPTAFRTYLGMSKPSALRRIGHLSDRDWDAVRNILRQLLG